MATYKATHSLRCPLYRYTAGGEAVPCQKKITGKGESDVSQEDAENRAEQQCYDRYNNHVFSDKNHRRFTS